MFADDTNLFFEHTDLRILLSFVNDELSKIYEWFNTNKLSLIAFIKLSLIRWGCLKEGGVYKLFLILAGAFIGGRCLKEGGRLLEDLPHMHYIYLLYTRGIIERDLSL